MELNSKRKYKIRNLSQVQKNPGPALQTNLQKCLKYGLNEQKGKKPIYTHFEGRMRQNWGIYAR